MFQKSDIVSNRLLSIIPGDSMIIGNLVWQDLQSESGVQCANSGFATFFRGTSKYFVVGLFDTGLLANESLSVCHLYVIFVWLGYVVFSPAVKKDNIEVLQDYIHKHGGVFVSPQGTSEDIILQMSDDGNIVEVSKEDLTDALTRTWNHKTLLGKFKTSLMRHFLIVATFFLSF